MDKFPIQVGTKEVERGRRVGEIVALSTGLYESKEVFPFPGIDPVAYKEIKAAEEDYPGFTTPIDELIVRFQNEGVKVVLGDHPESGNVFVLPVESEDLEMDFIFPRQLLLSEGIDERLRELITQSRAFLEFSKAK